MARHYLDHASTTPLRPEAAAAIVAWCDGPAADPGRVHEEGRAARALVEGARQQVADLLGVRARQVVFTSGGTEAANAAVWGATRRRPGAVVLCAAVEHSAVREASERLAPVETLPVGGDGRIDPDGVSEALERHAQASPALVHCQWANHEVGTIQPAAEVVRRSREAGVLTHVDAAAACGHVDLALETVGADLVTLSAHKFGGPPGIGALIVRQGLRIPPLLVGGQQERARRAGMENVAGIVGFGAAAAALAGDGARAMRSEGARARRQTEALAAAALTVDGVSVVGPADPADRLPHVLCVGVEGVEAEPVLIGLDRAGVAAHSGSACSSESWEPSPVLEAMGVDPSHSLRLSVGWTTGEGDVAAFGATFAPVVERLRALRG